MWVMEAWDKKARKWAEMGRDSSKIKAMVIVKLGASKGFVTRATHPSGDKMRADPGRGFYHYRLLEKQEDEVPTDP